MKNTLTNSSVKYDKVASSEPKDMSFHKYSFPTAEPELQTLNPDEKLDFITIRGVFDTLEDQCIRLMESLDKARHELKTIAAERDHYKRFYRSMLIITT